MAVSEGTARVRYIGTGSTGPFAFNFKLYDEDHLLVTKTDTNGVDTTLTKTTDYSVSVATDYSSATVTLVDTLDGDGVDDGGSEILTLTRNPPISQAVEWPRNDPFPAETHERAADLAVMLVDRLNEKIGRSILLPESSTLSDLQIPSPDAGKALGWNDDEDELTNVSIPSIYVQASAPTGTIVPYSLWIDSDSADTDVYQYLSGSWADTGANLKGATGDQGYPGDDGDDGADGLFTGSEATVTARLGDLVPLKDVSDSNNPKFSTAANVAATGKVTIELMCFGSDEDVESGDGAGAVFWRVPEAYNGYEIIDVEAAHHTAGDTSGTTLQLHNITQTADILSTAMTIDTGETDTSTAATPAIIDTSEDDLTTGDLIRVDADAVPSGTAAKGLVVVLTIQKPAS